VNQPNEPCATHAAVAKSRPSSYGIALTDEKRVIPAYRLIVYDHKIVIGAMLKRAESDTALFSRRPK
jgi:hypothetical protein